MQRLRKEKISTSSGASNFPPVVVVGAGYSGLVCANILRRKGYDVVVVEAQNYVGGRVKQVKGLVDWKDIDLGSEFIHGERSVLKDLIDKNGWPCRLLFTWAQGDGETPQYPIGGGIGLYYLGKEKKLLRYDTEDPDIRKVNQVLWGLWQLKPAPGDRRTMDQYLRDNNVPERVLSLAEAGYANTLCASLDRLSLEGVCQLEAGWDKYGGGDYRLDNSMSIVTERLSTDVDIWTEWPVKSINYEKDTITVTSTTGSTIEASRVVVTVPLPILKDGDIDFTPSLPVEKIKAIKAIGFDNAIKIVMKFSKKFWPKEIHGVICADSFVPELWFEEMNRVGTLTYQSRPQKAPVPVPMNPDNKNTLTTVTTTTYINNVTGEVKASSQVAVLPAESYIVCGFATSKNAEKLSQLSRDQIIKGMLDQLDTMFRDKAAHNLLSLEGSMLNSEPNLEGVNFKAPASTHFMDCVVYDWGKQPYIKGGYSYPAPGAHSKVREQLAKPINDRLFFAGEATSTTSFMTLQGAMETGEIAAQLVIETLPKSVSHKPKAKL